ncbi:MAG: DUF3473 domain-containing protein [Gammaproteobacteria bacterium]|nr:DUF3473 domain-containing protein [Gammaproteobacteria bacterium]MCP5138159.1 DUF3473 domain-containing protein [Gammaproteobacteria bacterium]
MHEPTPIALSVDIEDWYHSVLGLSEGDWERVPDRVVETTETLLRVLADGQARGTFFVLGHVAARHPDLIRRIADAGHELACHGYAHRLVHRQTPEQFREDLQRSLEALDRAGAGPVRGYRAAYWSITREAAWALDILAEAGIEYDSSIYPTRTPIYGIPDAPHDPFRLHTPAGHSLIEYPPTVLRFPLRNLPIAGGIYLRLLPYPLVRAALRHCQRRGRAAMVYIHPPEFDPAKPRIPMPFAERLLHYTRLDAMRVKVPQLLRDFRFAPIGELLDKHIPRDTLPEWSLSSHP